MGGGQWSAQDLIDMRMQIKAIVPNILPEWAYRIKQVFD